MGTKRIDGLPVIDELGQITAIPVIIAGVTYQLDLATRVITPLQAQVNSIANAQTPVILDTITGTLAPTKVGPFSSGANLSAKIAELDVLSQTTVPAISSGLQQLFARMTSAEDRISVLEAVPPSPSPPVIVTTPTVAWPGGSANVGETGTITDGTYSGTSLNGSRTFQLVNNSVSIGPRFSGSTTPTVPNQGTAQIIEYAPYGSTGAEVANPSPVYAVAAAPAPPPQVPVVATAPTLAFTGGGAPDVGDTATITQGTYTGGTVTGRTGQVIVNDVFHSNVTNGATGNTFIVPTEAGSGARKLVYVEQAANTAGPPVPNTSQNYTVNLPAVPVNTVPPQILPTSADETTLLSPTLGTYTVNGTIVNNNTLTFTYRWTFDWTLTGSLSGATSANFTAPWLGTTGSYDVIFSDLTRKTTTLTNGLTSFSWTGAVTASAAVKVEVATTATLQLNANNIDHAARFFVTPTGAGGAGAEVEASNTVTAAAPPPAPSGHRFQSSISGAQWSTWNAQRSTFGDAKDAQALYNSIPTSGGTTLNAGSTAAQVNTALGANSIVFLNGGNYTWSSTVNIPSGKWLIGVAGQNINVTSTASDGINIGSGRCVNINVDGPRFPVSGGGEGVSFNLGSGGFGYKLSAVNPAGDSGYGYRMFSSGAVLVSCEVLGTLDNGTWDAIGENADGFAIKFAGASNNSVYDCHAFECSDDGFDSWQGNGTFYYGCTSDSNGKRIITFTGTVGNGATNATLTAPWPFTTASSGTGVYEIHFSNGNVRNATFTNGSATVTFAATSGGASNATADLYLGLGNGNGFKMGSGTGFNRLFQCDAADSTEYGYNYNGNTTHPQLVQCTSSGNGSGPYAYGDASNYDIS